MSKFTSYFIMDAIAYSYKVQRPRLWKMLVQEYLKNEEYLRCKDKAKKLYDVSRHI